MVSSFAIDESLKQLSTFDGSRMRARPEYQDPLLATFQSVPLSRLIDEELDRHYNPDGPVQMISRVFRRFRRQPLS